MRLRVLALAVAGEAEERGARRPAREGLVVAHIDPEPRLRRLSLREQRHDGVVAVKPPGGHDMGLDQGVQRRERGGAGPHLVRERRQAELHALARVALGLAVERLMLAELLEQDHGEEARARPAPRRRVEGRRRLGDPLAVATGELLADGLDDLPLAGDHLQRVGHVLAELHDAARAAAPAGLRRLDHHPLARQVVGKGLLRRAPAREGANLGLRLRGGLFGGLFGGPFGGLFGGPFGGPFGGELVLGRRGLELLELQLELVEQTLLALGALAVELAPERLDLEPQMGDQRLAARQHRLDVGRLGLRRRGPRLGLREGGAQRFDLGGGHGARLPRLLGMSQRNRQPGRG
jgi:hypothetical protein